MKVPFRFPHSTSAEREAFESFALGLHSGGFICHCWHGHGTHKLPFQHPHPDAGDGEFSFCPVFPVQSQAVQPPHFLWRSVVGGI